MKCLLYHMPAEVEQAKAFMAKLIDNGHTVQARNGGTFLRHPQIEDGFGAYLVSTACGRVADSYPGALLVDLKRPPAVSSDANAAPIKARKAPAKKSKGRSRKK